MGKENLSFFSENVDFQINNTEPIQDWIEKLIESYQKILGEITYIFCSDDYLLKVNQKHLNHDTFTDIITFDYTNNGIISGDIFISIDRIKENSVEFKTSFEDELHRVMAHGVLHLIGFKDKTKGEQTLMTKAEDHALSLFSEIVN